FASLMRPIATPATGAFTGTPASISDRLVPQTEAMELEPFDSVISETTRMTYGKASMSGMTALTPRDRKSTRLNSSHVSISYAVFCLKKKKNKVILRYNHKLALSIDL